MKWKICLIACINFSLLALPFQIEGCGPEIDPYDYYTSFFQSDLAGVSGYHPFLYSSTLFLYDTRESIDVSHATADEWIAYCGNHANPGQAYDFICRFSAAQLATLYHNIIDKESSPLPDSVSNNPLTRYFVSHRDLEALSYLRYAKKVEPQVTESWNDWDPPKVDSVQMARLINEGKSLYAHSKKSFIKLRYGYQITRLALYSGNFKDCIHYYEAYMQADPTQGILQDLGVSLEAGALFRTGHKLQAAVLFSREFSRSRVKRVSNYLSFDWCVRRLDASQRIQCLKLCQTLEDKANLLGLFSLGSIENEEASLRNIYEMDPGAEMLPVLAVREINKIEENYFSPTLAAKKGGTVIYYSWPDDGTQKKKMGKWLMEARSLAPFYDSLAHDPKVKEPALFEAGAAYLSYITRDFPRALQLLGEVERLHPTEKIKDQAALTRILVLINQKDKIDSNFEGALLSSIKWLGEKARIEEQGEQTDPNGYGGQIIPWHHFYRDLFSQVLAKRYYSQEESSKELLCIGTGEAIDSENYNTEDFLENRMQTAEIMKLYQLMRSPHKTPWDAYLCTHFPLSLNKVREVIAVSYTRDYDFNRAIIWMNRIHERNLDTLSRNPFADILMDNQDSTFSFDQGTFTKIAFLKEMARLKLKESQKKATAADLYKLALGFYNMTYYGRAWEMVSYGRSGADGYYIPKDALPYQREYYGCYTAEKYFQKALKAFGDSNAKARCLFMIAKCDQKRNAPPDYYMGSDYYQGLNSGVKDFLKFKYNRYFPELVSQYSHTSFFREAFNTCSYLKDFVRKK